MAESRRISWTASSAITCGSATSFGQTCSRKSKRQTSTEQFTLRLSDDLPANEHWLEASKGWYKHDAAPNWLYKFEEDIFFNVPTVSLWRRSTGREMLRVDMFSKSMDALAQSAPMVLLHTFFQNWVRLVKSWKDDGVAAEAKRQNSIPESRRSACLERVKSDELRKQAADELPQASTSSQGAITAAKSGITFEQLLEFDVQVQARYGSEYSYVNMHQVVKDLVKPICAKTKMSYARWKNCGPAQPEALVTHCWDEPFSTFVQSVKAVFATWRQKPAMFICAFALLQTEDPTLIASQLGDGLDNSPFVLALSVAKYFVVIRNPVVDLYCRAWCVLELAKAIQFGFLQRDYPAVFVSGPKTFANNSTSCVDAKASSPRDLSRILQFIHGSGVDAIDDLIFQFRQFESQF